MMDMFLYFNGPAKTFPVTCQASDAYKRYKPKEEDNREASWLVDRFVSELYLEALCKASWKCLSAVFRVSFNFH